MFGIFRKRQKRLAAKIEALIESDLDAAVEALAMARAKLPPEEAARLGATIRRALDARDHNDYLSRALAERRISATAACELLDVYQEAGYVSVDQFDMHRRHAFDAHRRELMELMTRSGTTRFDYFRLLDGYRAAGCLSQAELDELGGLVEAKLNPGMAARRLFAEARTSPDPELQESALRRYLTEFEGFPDYAQVASLYVSLRIDRLWKRLPSIRFAREATMDINKLNNLLEAYLPHTANLSEAVPIERIVRDFRSHGSEFKPEPDVADAISARHLNRLVMIVEKKSGAPGSYREERNQFVSIGARGRVKAVRPQAVLVSHGGNGFPYSQTWSFVDFVGTQFARVQRNSSYAVWDQDEIGLVKHRTPSPVFTHQYRQAVATMADLLERHRTDQTGPALLGLDSALQPADVEGGSDDAGS